MNKEVLFAQKLGEIRELAKEQGNYVTKEQVAEAFAELEFQEDQFQMVYDSKCMKKSWLQWKP